MPAFLPSLITFAGKNWKLLLGGLVVAFLGIKLVFAQADARHWRKATEAAKADLKLEIEKHKITLASVATCTNALDQQSKAVLDLKAASDKRQAEAAMAIREAQRASQSAEARAKALEASAGKGVSNSDALCTGSAAYQSAREGL